MLSKRMLLAPVLLVLLAAWFGWFGPTQFGGPASYITVSGFSMEPTLLNGDLAVLRTSDRYAAGDVVAYQSDEGLVIHRITGGDGQTGFVLQGDNRNQVDPTSPTADEVLGELWFDVPGAGARLQELREPRNFGYFAMALAALAGVGFGGHEYRRQRRRGRLMSTLRRQERDGQPRRARLETPDGPARDGAMPPGDGDGPRGLMGEWPPSITSMLLATVAVAGVFGVLFGALAFSAFRQATESSEYVERLSYEQSATMNYEVEVERSALYPRGTFTPAGEPLEAAAFDGSRDAPVGDSFATALAERINLELLYSLGADVDETSEVSGTISALLEIRAGRDGWTQRRSLIPETSFEGSEVAVDGSINLESLAALVERIEAETEYEPSQYELRVLTEVTLDGEVNGEPVTESFEPVFTFSYTRAQIGSDVRLIRDTERSIGDTVTLTERASFAGLDMTVSGARTLSVWGVAAALVVAGTAGALLYFGVGADEDAQIRQRYRSRLVTVASSGPGYPKETIRVASIHDLARVADRSGSLILVEGRIGGGGRRYFVPDGDEVYEYESRPGGRSSRPAAMEAR